ncbi:MAG: hypothetical protein ABL982_26305, partial [Vicinamibacterales bacterium]
SSTGSQFRLQTSMESVAEFRVNSGLAPAESGLGAGGNITASVGLDGVMLVDGGSADMSSEVLATIQGIQRFVEARTASTAPPVLFGAETRSSITESLRRDMPPKPIRYLLLTSAAPDHAGGNIALRNAGGTFTGGNVAGQLGDLSSYGAKIVAHENVQSRLLSSKDGKVPMPDRGIPTDTYYGAIMKMDSFFNGEGVVLYHQPSAYSDGDSIVNFRGSDVIAAGDLYFTDRYPMIDTGSGGTINGVISALNNIIDMSVSEFRSEGGTMIIPGHGRISDLADVAYYRDMVTILRDRVQDMVKKGMTLEQVKAAKLTADYDGLYGSTTGAWTTDMFLDAVFRTLPRPPAQPAAPRGAARPR